MKIEKIRLHNIRSYEEETVIFPEGAVLLAGEVGSGKTSILLALEYALFGLQPGQRGAGLLRSGTDEGEVELWCEIQGKKIHITRKLIRDKKGVSNEYAALTFEGVQTEYAIIELKSKILELLGYPSEFLKKTNLLYKYTVYTPQEQMKQIISEDPESRLSVLRHIFGINRYRIIKENSALALTRVKEEIRLEQGELKEEEKEKEELMMSKKQREEIEKRKEKEGKELQERIQEREVREKELKELEGKKKEREIFEKELEKTVLVLRTKEESLHSLEKDLHILEKNLSATPSFDHIRYGEVTKERYLLQSKKEAAQARIVELKTIITSTEEQEKMMVSRKEKVYRMHLCPTCLQDVPDHHKHNILNDAERTMRENKQKKEELVELQKKAITECKGIEQEVQKLEIERTGLENARAQEMHKVQSQARKIEITKTKELLRKDVQFLLLHVAALKENMFASGKFILLFTRKEKELKEAIMKEQEKKISCAETMKELEITLKFIEKQEKRISLLAEKRVFLERKIEMQEWLATRVAPLVEQIEQRVLLNIRKEFTKRISAWFSTIAGEGLSLELDETFTPVVLHKGAELDYGFLSGGERTALALAYRLALTSIVNTLIKTIHTRELIILDEPTEGFSEIQIDKMRTLLEELAYTQLILVSHEQKIEGFVDHIIRIRKEGDRSLTGNEQPQTLNRDSSAHLEG